VNLNGFPRGLGLLHERVLTTLLLWQGSAGQQPPCPAQGGPRPSPATPASRGNPGVPRSPPRGWMPAARVAA